ncbi:hydrogenase small subunit [Oscillochloris sp. ZM17-4]|uniref:hydrogenase small subunit n=1 Tax=Oscillochloris sp. ZM17-4 TaxID=2866714 RepID=UPI001C73DF65|nr:hydrogenase small subunit [Oscillochloris sp. ZM17-4]MBX0329841.1 hydrogenase small subunit [Oscillochloris sp. ZM17-4]
MADETIYQYLQREGVSRRQFLKICGALAVTLGISEASPLLAAGLTRPTSPTRLVAEALASKPRVPVMWLNFQDCTGCTEALTRSLSPTLTDLVLNKITIDYHETLSAASGVQADENKRMMMETYAGQYLLVVEGSVPTGANGNYCTIGGRTAVDLLQEAAAGAAAVIATGNCAAFGGIPMAQPNPTGAVPAYQLITDKPVAHIPGCPAIPEAFTGTLVNFLVFGKLPELDDLNRPITFYGTTVHDRCLRRPFYEAGKFANSFDDEGARKGWCLYKLGCKGPTTYNACAGIKWGGGLSFPIQSGHPCLGCSEPNFWDNGGFYQGQSAPIGRPTLTAAGVALAAGAVIGVANAGVNRLQKRHADTDEETTESLSG